MSNTVILTTGSAEGCAPGTAGQIGISLVYSRCSIISTVSHRSILAKSFCISSSVKPE